MCKYFIPFKIHKKWSAEVAISNNPFTWIGCFIHWKVETEDRSHFKCKDNNTQKSQNLR